MNASSHTQECIVSHTRIHNVIHVTYLNTQFKRIRTHTWMHHVILMNEGYRTPIHSATQSNHLNTFWHVPQLLLRFLAWPDTYRCVNTYMYVCMCVNIYLQLSMTHLKKNRGRGLETGNGRRGSDWKREECRIELKHAERRGEKGRKMGWETHDIYVYIYVYIHEWCGEGLQHLLSATKCAFSAR